MPGGSTLEAIPTIREEFPDTHIVVLTMQKEPAFAREALSAGALGYVLKEAAADKLVEAVRRAAVGESSLDVGESYLNPRLGARMAAESPPGLLTISQSASPPLDLRALLRVIVLAPDQLVDRDLAGKAADARQEGDAHEREAQQAHDEHHLDVRVG
jgi:DNA-binding NarL/FixJ family response regulator